MKAALIFAVIFAFFGYKIYQLAPLLPEGLENASISRQIHETIFRIYFRMAVTAERWGLIEDSAYAIRSLIALASNMNASALDIPGEQAMIANIPVMIFKKDPNAKNQKAIVYFHGGGHALGNARSYSPWTSLLAKRTGAVVISVDYRLSPKHPFPAALEDCIKVAKAVFDSAQAMGLDRNRIAVAGDSAGANLAAVISLQLAADERYKLKAQVLFSVVTLPSGVLPLPSVEKYSHIYPIPAGWFLTKLAGQKYTQAVEASVANRQYISWEDTQRIARYIQMSMLPKDLLALIKDGSSTEMDLTDSGLRKAAMAALPDEVKAVSKLALNERYWLLLLENDPDLAKMPPAFFSVCEYDMRRDEALLFFSKLRSLGVPVVLSFLEKAEHIEPVLNVLTASKPTAAAQKGLDDAISYLIEKL